MAVMTVSMVLTFALITVQTRVLRQASSAAVAGDRAHYASDLASNFAALVGIAGSAWLGLNAFDAVAALVVAALLLWGAVSVFREAANQLMDRELPDAERAEILALVTADARLGGVHHFRTRASGPYVHVQMHVDLDPGLTLEAAQKLIVEAEKRVLARFPLADVIIHADPRGGGEPDVGVFADADPGQ